MTPHRKQHAMADGRRAQRRESASHGLHSAVIKIVLAATLVAVLSIWLTFGWAAEIGYLLAVVSFFTLVFFAILLLSLSYTLDDLRWQQPTTDFGKFLKEKVALQDGRVSGREALVQIAMLPVALALAFALIGLIWSVLH